MDMFGTTYRYLILITFIDLEINMLHFALPFINLITNVKPVKFTSLPPSLIV